MVKEKVNITSITNITNKFGIHIIRREKWHRLQKFVVIFGTNYICKFINRTFAKKPPLVQFEYRRRFYYEKTLFEQFGGTYTQQSDYLLPNLTLQAEEKTGYIRVWVNAG